MVSKSPEVTGLRDSRPCPVDLGNLIRFVRRVVAEFTDQDVDFGSVEPRNGDIKIWLDRQILQLESQQPDCPNPQVRPAGCLL